MVEKYKGHYLYKQNVVENWNSSVGGVYYLGSINNNKLTVLYVGRGIGKEGIRGRLLQHLNTDRFEKVTHFGYEACSTDKEAEDHEASEIKLIDPKYNKVGK